MPELRESPDPAIAAGPARHFLPDRARWRRHAACGLMAVVALVLPFIGAQAAALVPHNALYDIRLLSAREGSNIERVAGKMAIRWEADCSGWTMTHRTLFDVGLAEGGALRLAMDASTWEAVPASRYTFSVNTRINGREVERLEGVARKDTAGKSGAAPQAVFSAPEETVMDLPADVMFPTEHTRAALDAAAAGRRVLSATVFDGFTKDGPAIVNAVIGKPRKGPEHGSFPPLAGRRAWPMSLAFFSLDRAEAEPQSESGTLIFDNGVAERFDMNFGEFTVRAELSTLDAFPAPACE